MENTKKRENNARMMPHSIEAEQSVLGCNLIDENVPITVMSELKTSDFYTEAHKRIFDAMRAVFNKNQPIDFVTLIDQLEREGLLESIGGIDYITTLTNIVPSSANVKHYINIVKRDSILRSLISASQQIIEKAYNGEDKDSALSFSEKSIFDISRGEETSTLTHIATPLNTVIEKFEMIAKDKDCLRGVPTGFAGLDKITNGLQKSDLIIVAARPGVGKTSLAMNIINNAAILGKRKCAVFSLEMPKEQLAQRSLCSIAGVSMSKALSGELNQSDWKALWAGSKKLGEAQIYIDDSSINDPIKILGKCRRLSREHGLDLVMIDYLQLMNSATQNKDRSRQLEISELTRNLKIAARELNVPIILLSQLSRDIEKEKGRKPVLSDLRESGAIEQDADIVMFIHNPNGYQENPDFAPNIYQIIIAKHRNGSLAEVEVKWVPEITSFVDVGANANVGSLEKTAPPPPPPPAPPAPKSAQAAKGNSGFDSMKDQVVGAMEEIKDINIDDKF